MDRFFEIGTLLGRLEIHMARQSATSERQATSIERLRDEVQDLQLTLEDAISSMKKDSGVDRDKIQWRQLPWVQIVGIIMLGLIGIKGNVEPEGLRAIALALLGVPE